MTKALSIRGCNADGRWKAANPQRGANFDDAARSFIARFGHDKRFTPEAFDEWASQEGLLLNVPPQETKVNDDAWVAHCDRRRRLKRGLNKAGSHPRLPRDQRFVIHIEKPSKGNGSRREWVAVRVTEAVAVIQPIVETYARLESMILDTAHVLEGVDWSAIPAAVVSRIEERWHGLIEEAQQLQLKALASREKDKRIIAELKRHGLSSRDVGAIESVFRRLQATS